MKRPRPMPPWLVTMHHPMQWLLALTLILIAAPAVRAQAPAIRIQLSPRACYEGDSVTYRVTLENLSSDVQPRLEEHKDFKIDGPHRTQSTFESGFRRGPTRITSYDYTLTPQRSGKLIVPSAKVTYRGKVYTSKPLELTVRPPEDQDLISVEQTVDKDDVYLTQPFSITLTIRVKGLPGLLRREDPVSVLRESPQLQISWLDSLPKGIVPTRKWESWISQLRPRTSRGFFVNRLGVGGRRVAFQFPASRIDAVDRGGQKTTYWQYRVKREFRSQRVGSVTFERAQLKGRFCRQTDGRGRMMYERVAAFSKGLVIRVNDGPAEGRPKAYTGVVGKMDVSAALTPVSMQVGEPATLVVTLRGKASLDNAVAPDLTSIPGIQDRFKIYDSTSKSSTDSKSFTYSLRAKKAGEGHLPAIPMAYFDVEKEEYVTLRTAPIKVNVAAADQLSTGELVGGGKRRGDGDIEVSRDGIFANISEPAALRNRAIRPNSWFLGFFGILGAFVATLAVARKYQHRSGDVAGRRRRQAEANARQRIEEAAALPLGRQPERLGQALATAIADIGGLEADGLTRNDVIQQLTLWEVDRPIVDDVARLLDECDAARYGGSEAAPKYIERTRSLLPKLFDQFRELKLLK